MITHGSWSGTNRFAKCENGQHMAQELDPRAGAYLLRSIVDSIDSGRIEAEPSVAQRLRVALDNLESIAGQESEKRESLPLYCQLQWLNILFYQAMETENSIK